MPWNSGVAVDGQLEPALLDPVNHDDKPEGGGGDRHERAECNTGSSEPPIHPLSFRRDENDDAHDP